MIHTSKQLKDKVRKQMAVRQTGTNCQSSVGIFSSKIKCGNCGSWYGSKVWHSNDKYRRVIWQCNHKFPCGEYGIGDVLLMDKWE